MDGITTLFRVMDHEPNISQAPLCRSIMIMSSFMIENVFWNAIEIFRAENKLHKCCLTILDTDTKKKIGISKAMAKWPDILVGKHFDYSSEPFTSTKCLIDERNKIVHSDRISYYSSYIDTVRGATAAYYTALMSAKSIWKHFFGHENEIYNSFETTFPPPEKIYFQNALNEAKKYSIRMLEPEEFPSALKSLDEYRCMTSEVCENIVDKIFGLQGVDIIGNAINECEYPIKLTETFKSAYKLLPKNVKESVLKNLTPLLKALKRKKLLSYYGVKFGEVLPHARLNIRRIKFKNHHGYMCLPAEEFLVIFIIDTSTIELTDIIKNA